MATSKTLSASLKGLPRASAAALARQFAGIDLTKIGKVHVHTHGIPVPEEWLVSVLPATPDHARLLVESLIARPNYTRFEVFPYGILNPEIGRIDIRIGAH